MAVILYACDVGSTRVRDGEIKFGWARLIERNGNPAITGGNNIDACIASMRADIRTEHCLALGMESPMFLPVPKVITGLSCGRPGEADRSCLAPAGGYVAALGLHQLAYILQALAYAKLRAVFNVATWASRRQPTELLLWEAFVSRGAHCPSGDVYSGVRDAATAVAELRRRIAEREYPSDVRLGEDTDAFSLAGSALLWAGWSADLALLRQPVFVVRPQRRYEGELAIVNAHA